MWSSRWRGLCLVHHSFPCAWYIAESSIHISWMKESMKEIIFLNFSFLIIFSLLLKLHTNRGLCLLKEKIYNVIWFFSSWWLSVIKHSMVLSCHDAFRDSENRYYYFPWPSEFPNNWSFLFFGLFSYYFLLVCHSAAVSMSDINNPALGMGDSYSLFPVFAASNLPQTGEENVQFC